MCCLAVAEVPPSPELEIYLSRDQGRGALTYVQGSLLNEETCHRAGVQFAKV